MRTRVFGGINPSQLQLEILTELVTKGEECTPRGKKILELRPTVIEYHNPRMRMTFNKGRTPNPFFLLAESLWIIRGSSDAKWLSEYNSNMINFSDDGRTFNAPYGERLRFWNKNDFRGFILNPIDQLKDAYIKLKADRDTRQAVCVISNPLFDNSSYTIEMGGKDIACLKGNSIVHSPEGDLTIEELSQKFSEGSIVQYPVYSYNETEKRKEIKWCKKAWETKISDSVYRVTLVDGSCIEATDDHIFYVKRRYYTMEVNPGTGVKYPRCSSKVEQCKLSDLRVGDTLCVLNRYDDNGYTSFASDSLSYKRQGGVKEHRAYKELSLGRKLLPEEVVHHIDGNTSFNKDFNLEVMNKIQHDSLDMEGNTRQAGFSKKRLPEEELTREAILETAIKVLTARGSLNKELLGEEFVLSGWQSAIRRHFGSLSALKKEVSESTGISTRVNGFGDNNKRNKCSIISIEKVEGEHKVYDLFVEDNHNFFANNILVHNCNLILTFKLRGDKLDMTVFNRSNDLIWGTFTNLHQFGTILDMMAAWLGVEVGTYYQISDSTHIYTEDYGSEASTSILKAYGLEGLKQGDSPELPRVIQFTSGDEPHITSDYEQTSGILSYYFTFIDPLLSKPETLSSAVSVDQILEHINSCPDEYFKMTFSAMFAYRANKLGEMSALVKAMNNIPMCSWKVSCLRFLYNKNKDSADFQSLYKNMPEDVVDYITKKGE